MRRLAFVISLIGCAPGLAQISTEQVLSRLSEEAAVFQQNLPKSLTQETLSQKAWMPPSRFQPSSGSRIVTVPKPRLVSHEVVRSEERRVGKECSS